MCVISSAEFSSSLYSLNVGNHFQEYQGHKIHHCYKRPVAYGPLYTRDTKSALHDEMRTRQRACTGSKAPAKQVGDGKELRVRVDRCEERC